MNKPRQPFKLIRDDAPAPQDLVADLEHLLEQAKKGEVIGMAYVAMRSKQRGYVMHTSGEAHRNPTFTRGMLAALDDELAHRVRYG